MQKTNKQKLEEFIRVDHAGERGAIKIYEGQLLALNTIIKDETLKKKIEDMKKHEDEHCSFFENEIKKISLNKEKKMEYELSEIEILSEGKAVDRLLKNIYKTELALSQKI